MIIKREHCPKCDRRRLATDGFFVCCQTLFGAAREVHFAPAEALIIELLRFATTPIPLNDIIEALWLERGLVEPNNSINQARVYMSILRRKLECAGLGLSNRTYFGYMIKGKP